MRRNALFLLTLLMLMLGFVTIPERSAWAAPETAALKSVALSAGPSATDLVLHVNGNYSYKTAQTSPDNLFIDLEGVRNSGAARSEQWSNSVLSGYKLLSYQDSSGQSVVRIQVDLKRAVPPVVKQDESGLRVHYAVGSTSATEIAALPSVPQPPSPSLNTASAPRKDLNVSGVTFDKQNSGETFVDVATSSAPTYKVLTLPSPKRLVVDIEDAVNRSAQKSFPVDTATLKDVRLGQLSVGDPSVVRIVADLNGNPSFDVHSTAKGVRIELHPRDVSSTPIADAKPATTAPKAIARTESVQASSLASTITKTEPAELKAPAGTLKSSVISVAPPKSQPAKATQAAVPQTKPAEAVNPATAKPVVFEPRIEVAQGKPTANQVQIQQPVKSAPVATAALAVSKRETLVPPVLIDSTKKVEPPAPVVPVTKPVAVTAPTVQVVSHETVKPEVKSTLPVLTASNEAVAAPLPPPASVTPEALRADNAALTLGANREDAAQSGMPATMIGAPAESRPSYTGEPISLNLKDVDLKDFFRLIHEISGLNIILDPNVAGSVTLVLDSVPWDQALDIVLKNNRLGKVLEGNVLRIARIETLTAEQEGQTKLLQARIDAAPLVTVFRPINYAKATEISALLKTWAGGGALSRRGTVLVDVRSNTLIVSDVQSQIPIIENIVSRIDRKAKQISIEARVVLATADFTRTLSAALLGGFQNHSTVTTGTTGANSSISIPVPTATQPIPITTATSAVASGFGVASIVNVGANYFINAAISAAELRDQAKTISRPSIVTQNNVQGMVMQGVQVPIQTSINNTIAVQYENATLQLTVTPQVTDDNNIFLAIMVNNASVGPVVSGAGPSINTQQATTSVLVPDGGTVVFGGITVTNRSKSATYIPLLGNIPVLGHLFKTSNTTDGDQELLFFVTPKVLP